MTPREQANQRIKAVERALTNARGKWSEPMVTLNSWIGGTPQSQVLTALTSIELLGVNTWMARSATIRDDDQATWDKWTKEGDDLLANIASTAQDADHGRLDKIVASTVTAAAQDARAAAVAVWDAKGMIIAGLVAILGLYVAWRLL